MTQVEKSFGIIPFRFCKGGCIEAFMVKHIGGHWTFPKGQPEPLESPGATAIRELHEETGLSIIRLLDVPPLEEQYSFERNNEEIQKKVVYYCAEVKGEIQLQEGEVVDGKWIDIRKAHTLATYPETKNLCKKLATMQLNGFSEERANS